MTTSNWSSAIDTVHYIIDIDTNQFWYENNQAEKKKMSWFSENPICDFITYLNFYTSKKSKTYRLSVAKIIYYAKKHIKDTLIYIRVEKIINAARVISSYTFNQSVKLNNEIIAMNKTNTSSRIISGRNNAHGQ